MSNRSHGPEDAHTGEAPQRLSGQSVETLTRDDLLDFVLRAFDGFYETRHDPPVVLSGDVEQQLERVLGGVVTNADNGSAQALGWPNANALIGLTVIQAYHHVGEDRAVSAVRNALIRLRETGGSRTFLHHRLIDNSGKERWFEERPIPIVEDGAVYRSWAGFREITGEVALEQANLELAQQMERGRRLQSLGQMAGCVAHDFNNMLTAILANVHMAGERLRHNPAGAEHCLHQIELASLRAATLSSQLLTFAKGRPGTKRPLLLSEIVSEIAPMLRRLLPENIGLTIAQPTDEQAVLCDVVQIEQVILNLCVNARDAIPASGGSIGIAFDGQRQLDFRSLRKLRAQPDVEPGTFMMVSVRDTGAGIPADNLQSIFEPFFTTKETQSGTGLGLATVLGAVHDHGGVVAVESEAGQGSTFQVYLPVTGQPAAALHSETEGARTSVGGGGRVLVVDDEEAVLHSLEVALAGFGFEVRTAANRDEGLQALHREHFDLVLTDLVMPGMTLDAFLAQVRRWPRMRFLIMSGYTGPMVNRTLFQDPRYPLINKPFSPAQLATRISKILGERSAEPRTEETPRTPP